jgi:hypothetical protein
MSQYGFEMFADVLVYSQAFLMTRLGGVKDFLTAHGPFPVLWVDSVVGFLEIFQQRSGVQHPFDNSGLWL